MFIICRKREEFSEEEDSVDGDFPAYCVKSSPKQGEQQNSSDECVLLEESVTRSKVCPVLNSAKNYSVDVLAWDYIPDKLYVTIYIICEASLSLVILLA